MLIAALFVLFYHVVTSERGVVVVRKKYLGVEDTFVDIKGWQYQDFRRHKALTESLERSGYGNIVREALVNDAQRAATDLDRQINEGMKDAATKGLEWLNSKTTGASGKQPDALRTRTRNDYAKYWGANSPFGVPSNEREWNEFLKYVNEQERDSQHVRDLTVMSYNPCKSLWKKKWCLAPKKETMSPEEIFERSETPR